MINTTHRLPKKPNGLPTSLEPDVFNSLLQRYMDVAKCDTIVKHVSVWWLLMT